MSHTASRVIQACAKHGSDADRQALLTEAAPRIVDLAKSSYGHFLLSKLVSAAPKSQIAGACATTFVMPCTATDANDAFQILRYLTDGRLSLPEGGHPSNLRHTCAVPCHT